MSEKTPIIGSIPNPEHLDGERVYFELAPESIRALALEIMAIQQEMQAMQQQEKRDEELITFRQVEKEYGLNYYNMMKLKARGVVEYTYVNGHPMMSRKEAKRQKALKGKHSKI